MDDIFDKIDDTFYLIEQNDKLKEAMHDFNASVTDDVLKLATEKGFNEEFIPFFKESNGYIFQWSSVDNESLIGKINILKLEHILGPWEGDLYFEEEPQDSQLRVFHPIDQFSEEAHCGILLGEEGKQRMYFHNYGEDELYDLMIDLSGYLQLALEARGFFYWQKYLLELLYGMESEESENFKKFMPQLFEGFSLEEFDKQIETFKLK